MILPVASIVVLVVGGAPALLVRGRAGEMTSTASDSVLYLFYIFVALPAGVAWIVLFPNLGGGR